MMNFITSKDNQKIKDLIKLRDDKKYRDNKSLYYIEGERIINDTSCDLIECIYINESAKDKFTKIIDRFNDDKIYIVSEDVYNKIKDTVNSQGIIAIVHSNILHNIDDSLINNLKFVLILDNIQDPGNLGTILRVAEASGVSLVMLSHDCCDIYNTKVLRAGMSSVSRMKIYISDNLLDDIKILQNNGFTIYSTAIKDNTDYYNKVKYNEKTAIIIGNEGNGIKKELINISNKAIMIPMEGSIESLNAAIATAVICYEVHNQIKNYESK